MPNGTLQQSLIAHWPFAGDCDEQSGTDLQVRNNGVEPVAAGPEGRSGAAFSGKGAFIEVQDHPALKPGTADFSLAVWVHTDVERGDVIGDIISKFDPDARKGTQLYLLTHTGMTTGAQSNYRNLQFGIDDARLDPEWADRGRPGNAAKITSLAVSKGTLYAGTLEIGPDEIGHLWRYEGDSGWTDLGNPLGCNAVQSVVEFDGTLYCGLGRYNCAGSTLGETLNRTPGGKVYRLDPDGRWIYCGHPGAEDATPEDVPAEGYATGKADDVFALAAYRGNLYCTSNHRRGAFVYEGGENWKYIGPDERVLTFTIYRGDLYALINGGPVYRYEGGSNWVHCGGPETSTQTYSGLTYEGQLYVGTWPEGEVYRYGGEDTWDLVGRVGYAREIMGMGLYNGKAYIGSLPMANVWRMDGGNFAFVGNLDAASAPLRRVWTMAVYQGKLFAGTLPSGHVWSIEAGKMATWDETFPPGWHHVAAVKGGSTLRLYVDGKQVTASTGFNPGGYDLDNDNPLRIGFGTHDYFNGMMSDLRIYGRSLTESEVGSLAT